MFSLGALLCFPSLLLMHLLMITALVDVTHLHGCCHAETIISIVFAIIVVCIVLYYLVKWYRNKKKQENSEPATEVPTSPKKPEYQPSGASYTLAPQSEYGTGINGDTSVPAASSDTQPSVSPYALYQPGTQAASPPESVSAAPPPAFPYGNAVNSNQAAPQNLPAV
jgi:hypothetical protein